MATHIGNDGTALVLVPGYPQLTRKDDGKWEARYRYWCAQASAEGLIPAHHAACTLTGHTDLELNGVEISPYGNTPDRVFVDLVYSDPAATGYSIVPVVGTVFQESETSFFEVPVEDAGAAMTQANIDTAIGLNARTVKKCSVSYSRTEVKSSFTWSESAIVHDEATGTYLVGRLMAPTGLTSPSANKWLFTSKSVRTVNSSLIEIRESWTYDDNQWNTITPNAY